MKSTQKKSLNINLLSEKDINKELEKGYADIKAGRTQPAEKVFADIRKDYKI
jgi:DNA-damage-inducible protein J